MSFRYALSKYIKDPERYPDSVIYYDAKVVIIKDSFPKSILHYLILTRSSVKTRQLPTLAFKDHSFKNEMMKYIEIAKVEMLKEFALKYESKIDIEEFMLIGCHSVPSMSNLHIHVLTRDFQSPCLKHKKHYNSFNSAFFLPIDELPLPDKTKFEEVRYDPVQMEKLLKIEELKCSYCGENFGNKFQQLKQHLDAEFVKNFTIKDKS